MSHGHHRSRIERDGEIGQRCPTLLKTTKKSEILSKALTRPEVCRHRDLVIDAYFSGTPYLAKQSHRIVPLTESEATLMPKNAAMAGHWRVCRCFSSCEQSVYLASTRSKPRLLLTDLFFDY